MSTFFDSKSFSLLFGFLASTHPEIALDDPRVMSQFGARSLQGDLTVFENITVIRNLQGRARILFDQLNADAGFTQLTDVVQDFLDDKRRKPEARFVQHQQSRTAHERASKGKHLPFTT